MGYRGRKTRKIQLSSDDEEEGDYDYKCDELASVRNRQKRISSSDNEEDEDGGRKGVSARQGDRNAKESLVGRGYGSGSDGGDEDSGSEPEGYNRTMHYPIDVMDRRRRIMSLLAEQEADEEEEGTEEVLAGPVNTRAFLNEFYETHEEGMRANGSQRTER